VIVDDFYFRWSRFGPLKADPPALIDTDAEEAFAISEKFLKSIARRNG